MQPSVVDLFNKAADLPEEDRATLAGLLIESLETEIDEGVEQAWQAEVQRRLSELDFWLSENGALGIGSSPSMTARKLHYVRSFLKAA